MPKFDLIHPDAQIIGDGFIAWQWAAGDAVVESVYAARDSVGLTAGQYVISLKLPEVKEVGAPVFVFQDDAADVLGAAILSACRWQNEWQVHAGGYLLRALEREPADEVSAEADQADDDDNMKEVV